MKVEKYTEKPFDAFQWDGKENELFSIWGEAKKCVICDGEHGHNGLKDGATFNSEPVTHALFPCPGDYIVASYYMGPFGIAELHLNNYRPDAFNKIFERRD